MRIGFMLRNLREQGGIKVYTLNLLEELLALDCPHEFVFLYPDPGLLGTYAGRPRVRELVVRFPSKLGWDQVAVPWVARRLDLDVIVNPKLSVPVFTGRPSVFTLHGAEQFAVPEVFGSFDRIYTSIMMPLFCRRAAGIISTTRMGVDEIVRYVGADRRKLHPVHEAAHPRFGPLDPPAAEVIRERYQLPDRFILFVGGLNPLKNFSNLLRAYKRLESELPHALVVVGFLRWKYAEDVALIDELGLGERVIRPGFVPDEDLPGIYNLADCLAFPSLYEGFGIPILEAMACGCPVVTTKTGCSPEVAGDAALLVDPRNVEEIAEGIARVLRDRQLSQELVERGREQASRFSWKRAAEESLAVYELAAATRRGGQPGGGKPEESKRRREAVP
jgi:glycosyltransferase involved in cell wall biosynthesis